MKRIAGALLAALSVVGVCMLIPRSVSALVPPPGPSSGSAGVQGVLPGPPPSVAATIVTPANGASTNQASVTVSGACTTGLLVKIYDNGIFVGAAQCLRGTYSVVIGLFNGSNQLEAHIFDALDQEGPVSNSVTITFTDAQFAQFGSHVSVTSPYARRGADPNQPLTWPIIITGGLGPYAISIDWGDGSPQQLLSAKSPGQLDLKHTYSQAGTYNVFIKAADANGTEGFLQVIAVINGSTTGTSSTNKTEGSLTESGGSGTAAPVNKTILLASATILVILMPASFWLGRRYELAYLRQRIERDSMV